MLGPKHAFKPEASRDNEARQGHDSASALCSERLEEVHGYLQVRMEGRVTMVITLLKVLITLLITP